MTKNLQQLRPVRDEDAEDLFQLIEHCYSEYQGVVVERFGVDADLNQYATELAQLGGRGFVVEQSDHIVALVSGAPLDEARYQLKKLYVHRNQRGSGLASRLLENVETWARQHGAASLELWSDTRFKRAHSFYEREGFVKQDQTRALNDLSNSIEFQFVKGLHTS